MGLLSAPWLAAQTSFYEAYDQGLKAERAGRWDEAREQLMVAASLRPEAGRRVKTYGLNFLETYDPYLHLARVAVQLQRPEEADRNLARSRAAGASPAAEVKAVEADLARLRARLAPTVAPPAPPTAPPREVRPTRPPEALPTATIPPLRVERVPTPEPTRVALVRPAPLVATPHAPPERKVTAPPVPSRTQAAVGAITPSPAPSGAAVLGARRTGLPAAPPVTGARPEETGPVAFWIGGALALVIAGAVAFLYRRRRTATRADSGVQPTAYAPLVPVQPRSQEGVELGAYRLEKVLGRGGMGTTYRGRRTRDGLPVAVKIPHEHLLSKKEFVQRFIREGELGATLHHPSIIRIFEAGEVGGCPFIAMELVDGTTLEEVLEPGRPLPVHKALSIAREIALALDYAHMKGVVHRDLKPENVMVLSDGKAKVMDYGIARLLGAIGLTATDLYLGTPLYSAPESLRPSEVDTQSDLYSLGIILYRMLAGAAPFQSTNPLELLQKHANEPLPPFPAELGLDDEVWRLVSKLAAKEKVDRYESAELLLRDLDALLNRM